MHMRPYAALVQLTRVHRIYTLMEIAGNVWTRINVCSRYMNKLCK